MYFCKKKTDAKDDRSNMTSIGQNISISEERSPKLMNKVIKQTFIATILTSLSPLLALAADSIFVGNIVGVDALCAISQINPVMTFSYVLLYVFHMGANMMATKSLGAQRQDKARRYFTVAMVSSVALSVLIMIPSLIFRDEICEVLCSNQNVVPYMKDYYGIILLNLLPLSISSTLNFFISGEGFPKRTTIAVLAGVVVNIILDPLFIAIFDMGVRGAAIATVISTLTNLLIHIIFIFCYKTQYRFVSTKGSCRSILKENVKQGVAFNVINISINIFMMLLNALMSNVLGSESLFVWSICVQIHYVLFPICAGSTAGAVYLGNTMIGEDDWYAVRLVAKRLLLFNLIFYGALSLILWSFPVQVAWIFGVHDTASGLLCRIPVGSYSLFFVMYCFICAYTNIFQMMNHIAAKMFFMVQIIVIDYVFIRIGAMISVNWMWAGMVFGALLSTVITILYAVYLHKKDPTVSGFTTIPTVIHTQQLNVSLLYNGENVSQVLGEIKSFLTSCKVNSKQIETIVLCFDKVVSVIIENRKTMNGRNTFDVVVNNYEDRIVIISKIASTQKFFKLLSMPVSPFKNLNGLKEFKDKMDFHSVRYMYGMINTTMMWNKY